MNSHFPREMWIFVHFEVQSRAWKAATVLLILLSTNFNWTVYNMYRIGKARQISIWFTLAVGASAEKEKGNGQCQNVPLNWGRTRAGGGNAAKAARRPFYLSLRAAFPLTAPTFYAHHVPQLTQRFPWLTLQHCSFEYTTGWFVINYQDW